MAKPKVRVVVRYENRDRLLFSVRENGDQSLTVITRLARNFEDELEGKNIPIKGQKFSIHPSHASNGTTIVRTTELDEGRTVTSSLFVKDSSDSILSWFFSNLSADLGDSHYIVMPRARDTSVRIGSFSKSDSATLIYHIVVGDHQRAFPFIPGHSINVLEFKKWKLAVYSCYVNIAASPFGRMGYPASRPQQTNGVAEGWPIEESHGAASDTEDQLEPLLFESNNRMAALMVMQVIRHLAPHLEDALVNHQFNFHPNIQSLMGERQGGTSVYETRPKRELTTPIHFPPILK